MSIVCTLCGRDMMWSVLGKSPPYGYDRRCALNTCCSMLNGKTWLDVFPNYPVEWKEGVDEIWEED